MPVATFSDPALNSRPATYWDVPEAVCSNIKGQLRRELIEQYAAEGNLQGVPLQYFSDSCSSELLEQLQRGDPTSALLGEFLPDYLPDELEIARVVLDTPEPEVLSVRARREGGLIRYRVVGEAGHGDADPFSFTGNCTPAPLLGAELVRLVSKAARKRTNAPHVPVSGYCAAMANHSLGHPTDTAALILTFESAFYPGLKRRYRSQRTFRLGQLAGEAAKAKYGATKAKKRPASEAKPEGPAHD
jgi:hypothetical protein